MTQVKWVAKAALSSRKFEGWDDFQVPVVELSALTEVLEVLERCAEKLSLYRNVSTGEYVGGMEHAALMKQVNAVLAQLAPEKEG